MYHANHVSLTSSTSTCRTIKGPSKPIASELLTIPCLINTSVHATALIDSGAACCFISRSLAIQNKIHIHTGDEYRVTVADQSFTTTNQYVTITILLCGVTFTLSAIVMDALATGDIILGINFLRTFHPDINWNDLSMTIDTNKYTSMSTHELTGSDIVLASFTIVSPAVSHAHVHAISPVLPSVQPQSMSAATSVSMPSTSVINNRIKRVHIKQMKRLLADPANTILCSIYMLPTATATDTPANVPLNSAQILSGNNSNYYEQTTQPPVHYNEYELSIHNEYKDIFESMPKSLPPSRPHDHRIELVPGSTPPSKGAYRLSTSELDELRNQLDNLLECGFIRQSHSPFGAPMLFVRKKDGSLRMCIDYRALNNITIKNKYPLPRVDELLNRLGGARYFSKIDLQSGYHQIRMHESDIEKTAFRTRYGSFEFLVLPFGLTNAPSTFMQMMQDMLKPYLDKFCISFLDDILIYSATLADHQKHVRLIMDTLRDNKLYVKLSKCSLFQPSVEFLGYTISANGLSMVSDKVTAIQQWPTPTCVKHVRSFLGLAGFYRQFIKQFSATTSPLASLLQKDTTFTWTHEHQEAFDTIKQHMSQQPTLIIPRDDLPFVVHTDASAFAIGACLMQDHGRGLQPIAYLSKKLLPAETRYPTHEQELFAIVLALKHWRHHLYGPKHFTVYTDHKSLVYFNTQDQMSNRQARWSEFLQQYNFTIEYKPGPTNEVADALSRRHDHETTEQTRKQTTLVPLQQMSTSNLNTSVTNNDNILTKIKLAYEADPECNQILLDHSNNDNTSTWKVHDNGMIKRNNIYLVPNDETIRTYLISSHHDDNMSSHRGVTKTIDLVSRTFYWKHMNKDIKEYVSTCISCQQNKISNHSPLGLLHPIETPEQRWHTITMDLITSLPKTKSGYDCIVVVVDKLTKMAHYIPTVTDINAPKLAKLIVDNVIRLHGLPMEIISDRDPRFTSCFWRELFKHMGTKLKFSTAYHPQSDGQTERTNRTLEEQLRAHVNYHQNNWDEHLALCEFTYNNSKHSSTGYSPFFLNTGQHPTTPITYEVRKQDKTMINEAATTLLEQLYSTIEHARINIEKAQASQKKHADKHRSDFEQFNVGDEVLLSTTNLRDPGRAPKLCPQRIGPFKITKVVSKLTYELELPTTMSKIHNVFHVQQLTRYNFTDAFPSRPVVFPRPPATLLPDVKEELFEVQAILKHRYIGARRQYLVHWKGYPLHEATWEPASSFHSHRDILDKYEQHLPNNNTS